MKKIKNLRQGRLKKIIEFMNLVRQNPNVKARDQYSKLGLSATICSAAIKLNYIIPISTSKKYFKGYKFSYVECSNEMVYNIVRTERQIMNPSPNKALPKANKTIFVSTKENKFENATDEELVNELRRRGLIVEATKLTYVKL
jgi:hypothetical protein